MNLLQKADQRFINAILFRSSLKSISGIPCQHTKPHFYRRSSNVDSAFSTLERYKEKAKRFVLLDSDQLKRARRFSVLDQAYFARALDFNKNENQLPENVKRAIHLHFFKKSFYLCREIQKSSLFTNGDPKAFYKKPTVLLLYNAKAKLENRRWSQRFWMALEQNRRFCMESDDNGFLCLTRSNMLHERDLYMESVLCLQKSRTLLYHSKDRFAYHSFITKKPQMWLQKKGSIFSPGLKGDPLLFEGSHFYRWNSNRKLVYLYGTNLEKMSFLSSDLANLSLSSKTYIFLKEKGIDKIGSLASYSSKTLFQLLHRNKKMFAEIKRCFLLAAVSGNV